MVCGNLIPEVQCVKVCPIYLTLLFVMILLYVATIVCAPPSPPPNGYIIPYTSTVEGATVIFVFENVYQIDRQSVCTEVNVTAVCNQDGHWESSSVDIKFCEEMTGIIISVVYLFFLNSGRSNFCREYTKSKWIHISSSLLSCCDCACYRYNCSYSCWSFV